MACSWLAAEFNVFRRYAVVILAFFALLGYSVGHEVWIAYLQILAS